MKICLACQKKFLSEEWRCPECRKSPEERNGFLAFAPNLVESNEGFKAESFAKLFELETGNFWFRNRNKLLIGVLKRYFPQMTDFLEIGCGTGFVLSEIRKTFPHVALSGGDIFYEALQFCRKRLPDITLFQMDARTIPFENEFDVIGAFDVLEHIEEDETVLNQLYRAAKTEGGIMLTVPQHRFLWGSIDEYASHKRRYIRKELVRKVEKAGFVTVYVTSFVTLLFPVMVFSRIQQRRSKDNFDPYGEFIINRTLNRVFERILFIEHVFIKLGISLPLGGSLLLIAKKQSR